MSEQKSCLGCTHRYPSCHAECKIYAAWKANIEKEKVERSEALNDSVIYESYMGRIRRRRKAAKRHYR